MNRNRSFSIRCVWRIGLLWVSVVVLSGCAGSAQVAVKPASVEPVSADGSGWWYARFRMVWPQGIDPDWSMDPLIADRVVAPVLQRYRDSITLWRFHRRAVRDHAGHQFSFIFYASPTTAQKVYQAIERNTDLAQLKRDKKIEQVFFDDTEQITRPHYKDTSDTSWSNAVQKSWPYFIQGASRMWLELIQALVPEFEQARPDSVYALYHGVQDKLSRLWRDEGGHVLLHHLNALYAYQPVIVVERKLTRF